jgi:hypothetical protein
MADQETFSGAACCQPIELPSCKAAPLQFCLLELLELLELLNFSNS